jgi:hypothetical protein
MSVKRKVTYPAGSPRTTRTLDARCDRRSCRTYHPKRVLPARAEFASFRAGDDDETSSDDTTTTTEATTTTTEAVTTTTVPSAAVNVTFAAAVDADTATQAAETTSSWGDELV